GVHGERKRRETPGQTHTREVTGSSPVGPTRASWIATVRRGVSGGTVAIQERTANLEVTGQFNAGGQVRLTVLNPGPSEAENVELEFYKGTGEGLVSLGQPEPANNLAINGVLRCHLKLRTANE